MSLLDMPKPRITAQSRPGNRQMADARIKAAEAKLLNAKARHQRAAAALEAAKARAARASADAERRQRSEKAAWERVINVMSEYERHCRAADSTNPARVRSEAEIEMMRQRKADFDSFIALVNARR